MRKGFTLIELLIVLAVIAALMAIVTPIALNAVAQAKATQVASNMRNLKSAVESYVNIERPSTLATLTIADLTNAGYLSTTPGTDYALSGGAWQTDGSATATISFSGSVDKNKLKNVYPEVNITGTPKIDFTLRKWW